MATIENQICEAIETITGVMIEAAGFDKTIQATIVACVDEASGKYKVKYQDNSFYAYSGDVDKKYSKGNRVYILIPGNDMTRDKTILGVVGQNKEYASTEAGVVYNKVSNNFIMTQGSSYSIYSGTEYNLNETGIHSTPYSHYGKVIYDHDGLYNIKLLSDTTIKECIDSTSFIWLEMKLKTDFEEDISAGNYGLRVILLCQDDDGYYYYPLTFDIMHGIVGNIYDFSDFEYQNYVFPKPDNFVQIQKIEIFSKEFEKQLNDPKAEANVTNSDLDITLKELGIYAANSIDYSETSSGIDLIYPKGNFLLKRMTGIPLPVRAQVKDKGKIMADDANQFFWFKKDMSINNVNNPKYHKYGGLGWACLNNKSDTQWVPATNLFEFDGNEHLTAYRNYFKVVSYREVASSGVKYEKQFTLYNENNYDKVIEIFSNKDNNITTRAAEDLKITCRVKNKEPNAVYRYYWSINTNNFEWAEYDIIKNVFNCAIETEDGDGVIKNISLRKLDTSVNNYLIFNCTVKKIIDEEEINLSTESLPIFIEVKNANKYLLEIENGDQVFQYDESGQSPTFNGDRILEPLRVKLTNLEKNEIINISSKIIEGKLSIEWNLPENPNLIDVTQEDLNDPETINAGTANEVTYYKACNYRLKPSYVYGDSYSNNIGVTVYYDDLELTKYTNFTFLKQGDSNTNGTPYVARIIPNVDDGANPPRWPVLDVRTVSGYSIGTFNFSKNNESYTIDENGCYGYETFPFRVQLFYNGKLIYDGINGQNTYEGRRPEIKVSWEMLTRTYDSGQYKTLKDRSNFEIIKQNNETYSIAFHDTLYNDDENYYYSNQDKEHVPANILKCTVEYIPNSDANRTEYVEKTGESTDLENARIEKKVTIYATLPIVTIINKDSDYNLEFDVSSGYKEVTYDSDGCHPWYDSTNSVFKSRDLNGNASNCIGYIKGYTGLYGKWDELLDSSCEFTVGQNLIIDSKDERTNNFDKVVNPIYRFNGSSVTNAVLLKYSDDAYIHIPIDLHLNRYGLSMLNEWDGTSIDINNDGGYILTPQIGAGKKFANNTFTGIIMGDIKENGDSKLKTGLYALSQGERTFALMADSGICSIGRRGKSQIVIDPNANSGYIYSGNFFNSSAIDKETGLVDRNVLNNLWEKIDRSRRYENESSVLGDSGMLIDFTEGHIYFANGKFHLNPDGEMECLEGHISNKPDSIFRIKNYTSSGKPRYEDKNRGKFVENYFVDLKSYYDEQGKTVTKQKYFLYCRPELDEEQIKAGKDYYDEEPTFWVRKDGQLFANYGKIGGFSIDNYSISSYKNISTNVYNDRRTNITTIANEPYLTISSKPFTRPMTVVSPVDQNNSMYINWNEWSYSDNLWTHVITDYGDSSGGGGSVIVNDGDNGSSGSGNVIVNDGDNNHSGGSVIVDEGGNNSGGDDVIVLSSPRNLRTLAKSTTRDSIVVTNDYNDNDVIVNDHITTDDDVTISDITEGTIVVDDNSGNTYGEIITENIHIVYGRPTKIDIINGLEMNNLIIAIGENFAVTKEGRIHAKEIYMERTAFDTAICEHLVTLGRVRHAYNDSYSENAIVIEKDIYLVSHTDPNNEDIKYFPKIYIDGIRLDYTQLLSN